MDKCKRYRDPARGPSELVLIGSIRSRTGVFAVVLSNYESLPVLRLKRCMLPAQLECNLQVRV
jgi:hypothetical protein